MNKGLLILLVFSFLGCGKASRNVSPIGETKYTGGGKGSDRMPEVLPQNYQLAPKNEHPFLPPATPPTLPSLPSPSPTPNSRITIPQPTVPGKPQGRPMPIPVSTPVKLQPTPIATPVKVQPTPVVVPPRVQPTPISTPPLKAQPTATPHPTVTPVKLNSGSQPTPTPTPTPTPEVENPGRNKPLVPNPTPLVQPKASQDEIQMPNWEPSWSTFVMKTVEAKAPTLLKGPNDVDRFCPIYSKLEHEKRLKFWAHFFYSLAYVESGLNPYSRFLESGFDYNDPTTKQSVRSEGLLQLSYGDSRQYEFCKFDWSKDKKLKPWDHKKTIFDPEKNLECGIGILNELVDDGDGNLTTQGGRYWSVLRPQRLPFKKILRMLKYNKVCTENWLVQTDVVSSRR